MKKLAQTFFILGICCSAIAQNLKNERHSKILNLEDLVLKIKQGKNFPIEGSNNLKAQKTKPKCLQDSSIYKYTSLPSNSLITSQKTEYEYNNQYNEFIRRAYSWNSSPAGWLLNSRTITSHDANENIVEELRQNLSSLSTNSWVNSSKTSYTYNFNNDRISDTYQSWNSQTNVWKTNSVHLRTYTNAFFLLEEIIQETDFFNTSLLINSSRATYSYTSSNNLTQLLVYSWDQSTNTWLNEAKYSINSSGNTLSSYVAYFWDTVTNSWQKDYKGSLTYDLNNNVISQLEEAWDSSTNSWKNDYKSTNTYINNNLSSELDQTWNGTITQWENTNRSLYTYNSNNFNTSVTNETWKTNTNFWGNQNVTYKYYNCLTVGLAEKNILSQDFNLYPNPVINELTVKTDLDYTYVRIMNINGRLVISGDTKETVNVSSIEKGIYFIQLVDKNNVVLQTRKFIKE
jgi:hypothetical protein